MVGIHIETTSNGTHTGYVTAIETNGIVFKTTSVYFKTDTMSSQEDRYCLIDLQSDLLNRLKQSEESKEKITITFKDYLVTSLSECKRSDNGIITGIQQ